ncbi:hypothetical protein EJ08DRAFT_661633 [Tothia fuscella]|uniref:Uncharacterized protein n=1 Tax=Tothia fuscella TaxID=1048955 RepID=A0A9P4NQC6_9PEZI|nr:hypothetical protein EJ08DRAFT_661633 [Tothia fuscella]
MAQIKGMEVSMSGIASVKITPNSIVLEIRPEGSDRPTSAPAQTSNDNSSLTYDSKGPQVTGDDLPDPPTPEEHLAAKYPVDPDCSCIKCNEDLYKLTPHSIHPLEKEKDRPFSLSSHDSRHLPLCNLTDLYGYAPNALIDGIIQTFDLDALQLGDPVAHDDEEGINPPETDHNKENQPESPTAHDNTSPSKKDKTKGKERKVLTAQQIAIAEFKKWYRNSKVGKADSLKQFIEKNPEERISSYLLQYFFELFNDIFFHGALRGTRVVLRDLKKVTGLTSFPNINPDKSKKDTSNISILPVVTIAINVTMAMKELAVLEEEFDAKKTASGSKSKSITKEKNGKKETDNKIRKTFSFTNPETRVEETVKAPSTGLEYVMGVLLHEMAHALIGLFACTGTVIDYPELPLTQTCNDQVCNRLVNLNFGATGHGRLWFRLVKAIERNTKEFLDFETVLVGPDDLSSELKEENGWLPSNAHDIPEFFAHDQKARDKIALASRAKRANRSSSGVNITADERVGPAVGEEEHNEPPINNTGSQGSESGSSNEKSDRPSSDGSGKVVKANSTKSNKAAPRGPANRRRLKRRVSIASATNNTNQTCKRQRMH